MPSVRNAASIFAILLAAVPAFADKDALAKSIDDRGEQSWGMAKKIWDWAEPGYLEKQSSTLLADALEKAGFKVERGVAKIPTAITATFGEGKPVIGILGEYDALPELAQEAVPFRQQREGGSGYGQACGHHLFGVASASAAMAVAEQIKAGTIKGTVRFYGCPAEEGGAAKVFMARAGLFADCDVCLHWHPGSRNTAGDSSCLARIAVKFRFHGKAAHASGSPEKGRSALDALLLTMHAAELLREHTPEGTRLHHSITSGGGAANVVPEFAEGFFYVRHPKADTVAQLYPRLLKCAQAGALATETTLEVNNLGGTMELLPNESLTRLTRANLTKFNDLKYDAEETKFALRIRETFPDKAPPLDDLGHVFDSSGKITMGSTDVGDVSWQVPTTGFSTACWVPGTPGHSWQAVACGGTTIGKKGMQLAAKVLAATAWDLYQDPKAVAEAKGEFKRRLDGRVYKPMLEKDQPPPLDYRLPPKRRTAE
ncbi:MAG: amidohydrolase [Gemmataceae bacterium]|nr:amidohydrolase [Gemmataceae bacterium]